MNIHSGSDSLQIQNSDADPYCPRCSRPGIISALVPHTLTNSRGEGIPGRAVAVLCQTCDSDDPEAGALIVFFTVHGAITDETIEEAAPLLAAWANTAKVKPFDDAKLEAEYQAWLRDDL